MTDRVFELLRTMDDVELEAELRGAASGAGLQEPDDEETRHLVRVLTSSAMVATSVADLMRFADVIDTQEPQLLRVLDANPDDEQLTRVLAVPDHVRLLGDKCLFEAGVARRRGHRGIDLEDVGRRSYTKASRVLALLGEDRRLRRFYEDNALDRASLEHDVQFLARCSDLFSAHVRLLHAMLHSGVLGSTASGPGTGALVRASSCESAGRSPRASVRSKAGAALATRPAQVRPIAPDDDRSDDDDDDGGPRRVMDLHVVAKTDEEAAQARTRDLLAAEKTVLFSMLDPELLRAELKKVVIHQEEAIDSLCDEICLYATGTQDPKKPASYFLLGPTGVGKNYLVESLLRLFERLWGVEVPYLELEGPEFTYPSDINELKGAARGFIRSDEEGIMTKFHEKAHDKPFSVILIDEIEKAHPQLRRFFLPIMDRGTMMDNRGRTLNFVNTTIFFTSNIGYSEASQSTSPIGFGDEQSKERSEEAFVETRIRKTLSPEFINRVHMIHFRHLTRAAVDDIFDLEMSTIRKRYRQAQGLDLDITAAARAELLRRGYSHEYGARNLAKILNRWANIEVSKLIKRDEERGDADILPTLEMIRSMREGKRPLDMAQVRQAVQEATRARLDYHRVIVDVVDGEFEYRRG